MRRITPLTGLASLLIALPLGFLLFYPALVRCLFIPFSADFKLISQTGNTVYISQLMPIRQQQNLLANDRQASDRIRSFWSDKQGQATLIYCHTASQYADYCGGESSELSAGCSLGTPWGASFLVIKNRVSRRDAESQRRTSIKPFVVLYPQSVPSQAEDRFFSLRLCVYA